MAELEDELARHHRAAYGWALACCQWDRSAAEDVLQTAYLKIVDHRARFAGRSEFRTFLFGVIRQTAREERRRRAIRTVFPLSLLDHEPAAASIPHTGLADIMSDERSQQLVAALKLLPPRQRDMLHLVFYQDLTIAAAADVLGLSLGTARTHYERGKARLRTLLGDQ